MISIKASKHDDHSVEFKLGFSGRKNPKKQGSYTVNTWIFLPGSLDIDPETYGKDQFYRDIKSNIRLITPVYKLDTIVGDNSLPIRLLRESIENAAENPSEKAYATCEYNIKMFSAIFKSSLREHATLIVKSTDPSETDSLIRYMDSHVREILRCYRELRQIVKSPGLEENVMTLFRLGDEYMSRQVDYRTIRILYKANLAEESEGKRILLSLLADAREYRKRTGFRTFKPGDPKESAKMVHHYGLLKKFVESELYIKLKKRRDGFAVEQTYYSLAAGLAMIFATTVGWAFQVHFGNITWPLFVALVISYMLKDRIKELMRYYFAHRRLNRFFDHKARIRIGMDEVGEVKEGVDFIKPGQAPEEVRKLRLADAELPDEDRILEENILLYRNWMQINHEKLYKTASYPVDGINQILRLHVNRFTLKMDNPEVPVEVLVADGKTEVMSVPKYYKIHIVMQLSEEGAVRYKHFCLRMTRNGIVSVTQ